MNKLNETFVQSTNKKFIYWDNDFYNKVRIGARFWGWGKRKGKCRYFIFWIPFKEGCGECHF